MLEMKNEFEMRLSELVNEVQRSRRATEQSLSSSTDAIRADVRAHDSQFRVIESTVRSAVSQMRKHEEDKGALLSEVKSIIDQRSRAIADRVNDSSIASLDRALALERILDKESEERKQQNIHIKAEIENFRSGMRQNIHAESQQRRDGEKALRLELNESLLGLQEALQSVHENSSKMCNRTSDIASDNVSRLEKEVAALNTHVESLKTTHDAAIASLHMTAKALEEQSLLSKDHNAKSLQVHIFFVPHLAHHTSNFAQRYFSDADKRLHSISSWREGAAAEMRTLHSQVASLQRQLDSGVVSIGAGGNADSVSPAEATLRGKELRELERHLSQLIKEVENESMLLGRRLAAVETAVQGNERKLFSRMNSLEDHVSRGLEGIHTAAQIHKDAQRTVNDSVRHEIEQIKHAVHSLSMQLTSRFQDFSEDMRTLHHAVSSELFSQRTGIRAAVDDISKSFLHVSERLEDLDRAIQSEGQLPKSYAVLRDAYSRLNAVINTGWQCVPTTVEDMQLRLRYWRDDRGSSETFNGGNDFVDFRRPPSILHGHEVRLNSADSINALQMTDSEVDNFASPAKFLGKQPNIRVQHDEFLYTSDPDNDDHKGGFSPTDFDDSASPSPVFTNNGIDSQADEYSQNVLKRIQKPEPHTARHEASEEEQNRAALKIQARGRGMLARKQDPAELAKSSSVTKAQAREERQAQLRAKQGAALGGGDVDAQPEDAGVADGAALELNEAGSDGDEEPVRAVSDGALRAEASEEEQNRAALKIQARGRGMLARKQDPAELAKSSSVTKAQAREERQAQLRAKQGAALGGGDVDTQPEDAGVADGAALELNEAGI